MEPIKKLVVGKNHLWFLREGAGAHGAEPLDVVDVEASLQDRFVFAAEKDDAPGLRTPQLGALHAVLAHRSMESSEPITIVMPTGTGKTETMLAAYAHHPARTLVLVPSEALRNQIAKKFTTLGVLPIVGAVTGDFKCPTVAVIKSSLTTTDDVDELVTRANVVVATPQALAGCDENARTRLADLCERLFIDEAHHVAARTWRLVADLFTKKEVIQFTATPYRE
ncbi:MAG TPA: DEAD/DEAH box helicase family protein, partial [Ilumatobacter sp.]|nr:DEAD/DEAH box helicase family protein [Ilumatobacter sp.]